MDFLCKMRELGWNNSISKNYIYRVMLTGRSKAASSLESEHCIVISGAASLTEGTCKARKEVGWILQP